MSTQRPDPIPASLRYLAIAGAIVQQIAETQPANIEAAAQICANSIANDGLVFCWGGGHSRMSVEEMFPRIGSYQTVTTGYCAISGSMVKIGSCSTRLWATKMRSNGSR